MKDCFGSCGSATVTAGRIYPLLLLASVTEPDSDHLLLHLQLFGNHHDLLRGRLLVLQETLF